MKLRVATGVSVSPIFVALFAVCGGCSGPSLAPLEGTVTMDGQPLVNATVSFDRGEGPIEQRLYSGKTDAQGRYAAGPTWSSGTGVEPGSYKVMITSVELPPDADESTVLPPEPVPMRYRDGSIAIDVPEGGNTAQDFEFESVPQRRRR
ncbi:MAG: hypothetical protein CMJ58_00600 [Planctomycetaceae bacterium]|nr:hypothetical protein [Planctomycetaceae bacterium]